MAPPTDARNSELVTVERDLEAHADHLVSTVTIRSQTDVPAVVRVTDDVGGWSDATSVRIHPETEPERWTVDDGQLVLEALVTPATPTTVAYDLQDVTDASAATPITVEQTQPVDSEVDEAEVPRFRDTRTFDGDAAPCAPPSATEEATDADVREALAEIDEAMDTDALEQPDSVDRLDLSDPE
jgi:hypothetical protein